MAGQQITIRWEAPDALHGVEQTYEYLSGFQIEHNIPDQRSPLFVRHTTTSYTFEGVEAGTYEVAVRVINDLGNKSKAVRQTVVVSENFENPVQRVPGGLPFGGRSSSGVSIDKAGLFQFDSQTWNVKPSPYSDSISNSSSTASTWSQSCSTLPNITWSNRTNSTEFPVEHHYLLLDASDTTDRIKLIKYNKAYRHPFWYDAGTGNTTNAVGSNLTGTISKAVKSSTITGSGTSFTTELKVGSIIKVTTLELTYRVERILSDTSLEVDSSLPETFSGFTFAKNLDLDFSNDIIIGSVYKTSSGYFLTEYSSIDTSLNTVKKYPTQGLKHYYPCNSVNDNVITDSVSGVHGVFTAGTIAVDTSAPSGNGLVNYRGAELISHTDSSTLESGGFSASLWAKSTTTSGPQYARIIGRSASSYWSVIVDQGDSTDGQTLTFYANASTIDPATYSIGMLPNVWNQIGVTWDGTTFKGFVNGEEVVSGTGYNDTGYQRSITIGNASNYGGIPNNSTYAFVGSLSEVKLYDAPLSIAEMRSLYEYPGAGGVPGLMDAPIQLGQGTSVLKASSEGLSLGNDTFASAPFRVDMEGNMTATSGTFSGNLGADTVGGSQLTVSTTGSETGNVSGVSMILDPLSSTPISMRDIGTGNNIFSVSVVEGESKAHVNGTAGVDFISGVSAISEEALKAINPDYLGEIAGGATTYNNTFNSTTTFITTPTINELGICDITFDMFKIGTPVALTPSGPYPASDLPKWRVKVYRGVGVSGTLIYNKVWEGATWSAYDSSQSGYFKYYNIYIEDSFVDNHGGANEDGQYTIQAVKVDGLADDIASVTKIKAIGFDRNSLASVIGAEDATSSWVDKETGFTIKTGRVGGTGDATYVDTFADAFDQIHGVTLGYRFNYNNTVNYSNAKLMSFSDGSVTIRCGSYVTTYYIATGYTAV